MERFWSFAPTTAAVVATGLSILSVSSKHWIATSTSYSGLWKGCLNYFGTWVCVDITWVHPGTSICFVVFQGALRAHKWQNLKIEFWKIAYRKFLSNRTGASKRDIWTRAGNVIAPSLKY